MATDLHEPRAAVPEPPQPSRPAAVGSAGWTLALASLGVFLTSLDVVVVATALPAMRADLGAHLSGLEWTVNAYNLVFAVLMLTGAALGDRFGRRRAFVLGLLLFTLSSAAAALSGSVGALIAARVVQGAGAAVVLPLSLTLVSDAFPPEKRGAAIGIWGGVSGLGVAAGPVVGGAIVQAASWRWIFWLNVPVGLVVAVLSRRRLVESRGPRPQLDVRGLLLGAAGLTGLAWAAIRAPESGWGSAEVLGTLAAGVAGVAAFVRWERRAAYPMLPLGYFRLRGFWTANVVAFALTVSLFGALFFMTQLFQTGLGYSPLNAGVRMLVWMATPLLVAPIAGQLADRYGNRPFMVGGLLMQGAGLGWLAAVVSPHVGYPTLIAPLVIAGVGTSLVLPSMANAVVSSVPPADAGVAAGTNSAARELGGVFGIAILAAVFAVHGGYASRATFVDGFRAAITVAALVPIVGVVAAALSPSRAEAAGAR